ncbi:MAG TPA: HAD-IIIA family hydrolase [Usitatibacter sp.]|nr:HAD-IIIA family hydrolase [Usitatibacter sp.]
MKLDARARRVRLAIFDVDGVLTDGTIVIGPTGEAFKAFSILDGHGLKMLREAGIMTAILSGRSHRAVDRRAKELSIDHVIQGKSDKLPEFDKLIRRLKLAAKDCAYMGDDLPDLPVMRRCGLAVAPANAVKAVKDAAHHVTHARGGNGAVREMCELILRHRKQLGRVGEV